MCTTTKEPPMTILRRFTPLLAAAALLATFAIAVSHPPAGAQPDAATAAHASLDAVTAPSALPSAPVLDTAVAQVAIARVLAIEPGVAATNEVITAFALFMPSRPLPILAEAWAMPALTPPNRDVVPVIVRARAGKWSPRLRC